MSSSRSLSTLLTAVLESLSLLQLNRFPWVCCGRVCRLPEEVHGCSVSRTDYPDVRGVPGVGIFVGWAVSSSVVATLVWSGCDKQNELWSSVS